MAALAIAGGVTAASAVYGALENRKDRKEAVRRSDAQTAAAAQAETEAAQTANARVALRRRALQSQSLLTGGASPMPGRTTLGG